MHAVDAYQKAVAEANRETFASFGLQGPYDPDTAAREFWLAALDRNYSRLLAQ